MEERTEKGGSPIYTSATRGSFFNDIVELPLKGLSVHPENARIYGKPNEGLKVSMERSGQVFPIVIYNNLILSGARRYTAAKALGWKLIKTYTVADGTSEMDILRIIVESNQYRGVKSAAILAREAKVFLLLVEQGVMSKADLRALAKRGGVGSTNPLVEEKADATGRLAAGAVGISAKTLTDADYIMNEAKAELEINRAREWGKIDDTTHARLMESLSEARAKLERETRGVQPAAKKIRRSIEKIEMTKAERARREAEGDARTLLNCGRSFVEYAKRIKVSKLKEESVKELNAMLKEVKDVKRF